MPVALLFALFVLSFGLAARAEPPNPRATPIYILTLSTDDVDDQADALTLALRSRVRESQGWSLLESPQSFETLALALKCPSKPDTACLQRVADQIHADHYVWGKVAHRRAAPEVAAELHLWSRTKGDSEVVVTFSDNLKDASDAALRKVASRAFGKLVGSDANGTLVVRAGTAGGSVFVDGSIKGKLDGGIGRFDVGEGPHRVAVRVSGFDAQPQETNIAAGAEQDLSFVLTPEQPSAPDMAESAARNFPLKKVLGYPALIVGAGLLVGAGIGAALWIGDNNKSNDDRQHVPSSDTDVCATAAGSWASYAEDACKASKDATQVSTAAWIMGVSGAVLGGVGIVLLATDHSSSPETTHDARPAPNLDVVPLVGLRGGALDVRVTF